MGREEQVEAFFRMHSSSLIACTSAEELYDFASIVCGEGAANAVMEAIKAGRILDIRLRDHAAALAREGLTARRRRWEEIVNDQPDLRPYLVDSDLGVPPDGQRAVAAFWRLAYEVRAPFGDLSGLRIHPVHIAATVFLRRAFFRPTSVETEQRAALLVRLERRRDDLISHLFADKRIRNCFKLNEEGTEAVKKKGFLVPREGKLRSWLSTLSTRLQDQVGRSVVAPHVGSLISTAPVDWLLFAPMDDMLASWVEVDAVCRLADQLVSQLEPRIWTAFTVLPWVSATRSTFAELQAIAGDGWAAPRPGCGRLRVDYSDLYIASLALRWQEVIGHSSLADLIHDGVRPTEWAAARLLEMRDDQFASFAVTNSDEHARWTRLSCRLYYAAGLGLPAHASRHIAKRVTQDDDFVRAAESGLQRLYEDLHPDLLEYLARSPDPDRTLDRTWLGRTYTGLDVVKLNCLEARRVHHETAADFLVQALVVALAENGFQVVAVTDEDMRIEAESIVDAELIAVVEDLIERTIRPFLGKLPTHPLSRLPNHVALHSHVGLAY